MLVAAAVILIPEMLSGPRRQGGDQPAPVDGQAPLKTYTIDLSKSPATQAAASGAVDERAPPAESAAMPPAASATQPAAAVAQATAESDRAKLESTAESAPSSATSASDTGPAVAAEAAPQASSPQPASKSEPAPTPAEPPQRAPSPSVAPASAGSSSAHSANGWAVQLGSFSNQATAQRMVKDLRAKGNDAFVMPVKSGGGTMYRVRIGPLPDREAAAAALQRVKTLAPGAAIVAHP